MNRGPSISNVTNTTAQMSPPAASIAIDVQEFTASGTWIKPPGAKRCRVIIIGGGGGGGGGARVNSGTACSGGGGGGAASWMEADFDANDLNDTESVTIGVGGAAGAGATSVAGGSNGTAGGNSVFATTLSGLGGGFGNGGRASGHSGGGGGGGSLFKGSDASGATAGGGGAVGGSAGGSNSGSVASTNKYGGGGGGGGANSGAGGNGTGTLGSSSGGSAGGGLATTPVSLAPGITVVWSQATLTAGAPGDIVPAFGTGTGGVGGASAAVGVGQAAGAGIRGSGGGGGGSGIGGGGYGGAGGDGYCVVTTYLEGQSELNGAESDDITTAFLVGNSLLNDSAPVNLPAFALASGFGFDSGHHIRFSSSLGYIEANPTEASLVGYGLYSSQLLLPHDVVIMQSYAQTSWTMLDEQDAFLALADISAGNPTFYLYQSWPATSLIGGAYQTYWAEAVTDADATATINKRAFFRYLLARVNLSQRAYWIPIGDVFNQLDVEARAGRIPGATTVADLYSDGIHMGDIGRYAAGATITAVVGRRPPQGGTEALYRASVGPELTDAVAQLVRNVVWDLVRADSRTGV